MTSRRSARRTSDYVAAIGADDVAAIGADDVAAIGADDVVLIGARTTSHGPAWGRLDARATWRSRVPEGGSALRGCL